MKHTIERVAASEWGRKLFEPMQIARAREYRIAVSCALLLMVAWPGLAQAGRIEGRIRFAGSVQASQGLNPYPGQLGSELSAPEVDASPVEELALYLRGVSSGPQTGGSDGPELRQRNLRFDPRVLAIPVGTTVSFPNMDPVFHNVFSYSKPKRFDLGRYGKGKSKSVTFKKPGLVEVYCDVHSSMQAYILVIDSQYVTQPNKSGAFVIDNVPEGPQTLVIWHPDFGEQEFSVVVGTEPVRLDLSF